MDNEFGKIPLENLFTLGSLRKRLGLTLEEVAEFMGVTRKTISMIEKDSTDLGIETASMYANLYCVPLSLIFFGKECTLSAELKKRGGYFKGK